MSEQSESITQLERCLNSVRKQLLFMPEGALHVIHAQGHLRYYRYPGTGPHGDYLCREDEALIRELAQKKYLQKMEREIEKILNTLRSTPDPSLAMQKLTAVFNSLDPVRKRLVKPLILSDDDYAERWLATPYECKEFWGTDTAYMTKTGETVRSKSEKIIADLLHDRSIPYRYECALSLTGHRIFPDFTVLNRRTRQEIIWEHFGLIDKDIYAETALRKMNTYLSAGYIPGINLIVTFEAANCPLNIAVLEKTVEHFFL